MFATVCIAVITLLVVMPVTQQEENEMKRSETMKKPTKKPRPIIVFNPPGRTCTCEDYPCCGCGN